MMESTVDELAEKLFIAAMAGDTDRFVDAEAWPAGTAATFEAKKAFLAAEMFVAEKNRRRS